MIDTDLRNGTAARLQSIETRLAILEAKAQANEVREIAVEPWRFLVRRPQAWQKQLYLKGRNMTARQLVGAMTANQFDEVAVAADYRLPLEAVREAIAYVNSESELVATECEIERLMSTRGESSGGTQRVR